MTPARWFAAAVLSSVILASLWIRLWIAASRPDVVLAWRRGRV